LPLRKKIADVLANTESGGKGSPITLKLLNSVGRKAFNRLNNLFYDFNENIIYIDGCNLIITNPREDLYDPEGNVKMGSNI
jgi:hypothetical protein